ncbi:MAG TPA: hypothetical protein VLJ86_27690 [Ramlibacter sp.]|nr:hypothetical protein [Ramlibacter sp.]
MGHPNDDSSEKGGEQAAERPEYEIAYYTKELGRSLQRKMLQTQLAGLKDVAKRGVAIDPGSQLECPARTSDPPTQEDRTG